MPKPVYASMSDKELLAKLTDMSRYSNKAAFVVTLLTDDDLYHAVTELRKRCAERSEAGFVSESRVTETGRMHGASTVDVDPVRWKTYWANRRMRLGSVGPLVGLVPNWASVIAAKKKASYWTLDRIAVEIGVNTDDLVWAVGSDCERERVGLLA